MRITALQPPLCLYYPLGKEKIQEVAMKIDYEKLGARIRYARTQRGMSQEELAEMADVSTVYISNIESGTKSASLAVVVAVAGSLKVSIDTLVSDSLNPSEETEDAMAKVLLDCSKEENDILIASLQGLKRILRKYRIS